MILEEDVKNNLLKLLFQARMGRGGYKTNPREEMLVTAK